MDETWLDQIWEPVRADVVIQVCAVVLEAIFNGMVPESSVHSLKFSSATENGIKYLNHTKLNAAHGPSSGITQMARSLKYMSPVQMHKCIGEHVETHKHNE